MKSYRLSSSAFVRQDEQNKIVPKKIVFLAVEGDLTEKSYFQKVSKYLLVNKIVKIEVLGHKKEGYSSPKQLIDLLKECKNLRNNEDIIPKKIYCELCSEQQLEDTLKEKIESHVPLTKKEKNSLNNMLLAKEIDIAYRSFIKEYEAEYDIFAIIFDRDQGSHTKDFIKNCVDLCISNNFYFYITNPCFEFWLLLHVSDIKKEYSKEELQKMLQNVKVSNRHTYLSEQVSKKVGHYKKINDSAFKEYYLPNIGN